MARVFDNLVAWARFGSTLTRRSGAGAKWAVRNPGGRDDPNEVSHGLHRQFSPESCACMLSRRPAEARAPAPVRGIFGQPKGLYYLAATEAWERFSYYGMTALVVLYMVNQLLLPGHVENIAGFTGFRATLESVFGPMSTQALASQIFGLYSGFVYFTPVLGGWIADRFDRPAQRRRGGRGADERRPPGHGVRPELPGRVGAVDPRQRTPERQHFGSSGRALLHQRRNQSRARLHDLLDGDQCRRGVRADRLWVAGAALRLAYGIRRGRSVHPVRLW